MIEPVVRFSRGIESIVAMEHPLWAPSGNGWFWLNAGIRACKL
jgi:hypothetical protein